jgi:hypothetical protein
MTATLPLGANIEDPVVLPVVDRRQALELNEKRRCVVGNLTFTLETRLVGPSVAGPSGFYRSR